MRRMDDSGIADAFYTVLSVGMVLLAGIAISSAVLSMASGEGKKAADRMAAFDDGGMKKGLYGFYYEMDAPSSNLSSADPADIYLKRLASERTDEAIAFNQASSDVPIDNGNIIWTGYLYVPKDGNYTFELSSTDGSWLWIDGIQAIDNHGLHGTAPKLSATVRLTPGYHPVKVRYFYRSLKTASCNLRWDASGKMQTVNGLYR